MNNIENKEFQVSLPRFNAQNALETYDKLETTKRPVFQTLHYIDDKIAGAKATATKVGLYAVKALYFITGFVVWDAIAGLIGRVNDYRIERGQTKELIQARNALEDRTYTTAEFDYRDGNDQYKNADVKKYIKYNEAVKNYAEKIALATEDQNTAEGKVRVAQQMIKAIVAGVTITDTKATLQDLVPATATEIAKKSGESLAKSVLTQELNQVQLAKHVATEAKAIASFLGNEKEVEKVGDQIRSVVRHELTSKKNEKAFEKVQESFEKFLKNDDKMKELIAAKTDELTRAKNTEITTLAEAYKDVATLRADIEKETKELHEKKQMIYETTVHLKTLNPQQALDEKIASTLEKLATEGNEKHKSIEEKQKQLKELTAEFNKKLTKLDIILSDIKDVKKTVRTELTNDFKFITGKTSTNSEIAKLVREVKGQKAELTFSVEKLKTELLLSLAQDSKNEEEIISLIKELDPEHDIIGQLEQKNKKLYDGIDNEAEKKAKKTEEFKIIKKTLKEQNRTATAEEKQQANNIKFRIAQELKAEKRENNLKANTHSEELKKILKNILESKSPKETKKVYDLFEKEKTKEVPNLIDLDFEEPTFAT